MQRCRLHVMGASGSGTTTLARTSRTREVLTWASGYDDPEFTGRSLRAHEEWLAGLGRPVLTLDSAAAPTELRDAVLAWEPGP